MFYFIAQFYIFDKFKSAGVAPLQFLGDDTSFPLIYNVCILREIKSSYQLPITLYQLTT